MKKKRNEFGCQAPCTKIQHTGGKESAYILGILLIIQEKSYKYFTTIKYN